MSMQAGTLSPARTGWADARLYTVRPAVIWTFLQRQPAAYWLICFYLFVEYVRIQAAYPALDVIRWGLFSIIACLGAHLLSGKGFSLRPGISRLLVVMGAVVVISGFFAYRPDVTWQRIDLPLHWILIFFLITATVNTEQRFLVFLLSFLLYSLKMSIHSTRSWAEIGFQFRDWGTTGAPGWFHNSGEFGIQMCVFLPLACYFIVALHQHWTRTKLFCFVMMPITAVIGMVASSSRGALVGGASVVLWIIFRSRRRTRGFLVALSLAAAVVLLVPPEQKQRFATMGEDSTSESRLTYWKHGLQIAAQHPVFGVGYSNWIPYYRDHYFTNTADASRPDRLQLPHNLFVEGVAELGYVGLTVLLALMVATLTTNARTRRLAAQLGPEEGRFLYYMAHGVDGALVGYVVSGFFVTVLWYPYLWINLAMTVSLYEATRTKVRLSLLGRRAPQHAGNPARVSRLLVR